MAHRRTSTKGFKRADSLLSTQIRRASETRGFAQSRLLTRWAEVVGEDMAAIAQPVEVGYARGGFGATLTVLTKGTHAPVLEMQKEKLREKVNAVYGYNAISRVRITQTAPTGFAEGQMTFGSKPPAAPNSTPPALQESAAAAARDVADEGLRAALAHLGENVLAKGKT
ncbi:MAG: DciA family protein [Pseudomonadota bacterium]